VVKQGVSELLDGCLKDSVNIKIFTLSFKNRDKMRCELLHGRISW
jgi:hypothetical protein